MKIHFRGVYRYKNGVLGTGNESEEHYEFDWEGFDYSELFKLVRAFDEQYQKVSEEIEKSEKS